MFVNHTETIIVLCALGNICFMAIVKTGSIYGFVPLLLLLLIAVAKIIFIQLSLLILPDHVPVALL